MKKKSYIKYIIIFIILCIALIFGMREYFISQKFEYSGTLDVTKVDLSSQLSSLITTVTVYEGDHVSANQKVISLDCSDVKLEADLARINFMRYLTLRNEGTISQDSLDQVTNTKDITNVRVGWCEIYSPLNSVVLTRYHEPGEYAQPGTKILTIANIKDIWAYIYVPQPDVAKLKYGQKLRVRLPELNNREFIGHIIKINDEAEFTPKNVQTQKERERLIYGIKVSFLGSNDDEILKPGMTIYVPSLEPVL